MQNRTLLWLLALSFNSILAQTNKNVKDIKAKNAYMCMFVSIKDNTEDNSIFLGLVSGKKFDKYINSEFNPVYLNTEKASKIEKEIIQGMILELPESSFDAYLSMERNKIINAKGVEEAKILFADSVFVSNFSYSNFIHSNCFSKKGCYIKVLKVNVDYLEVNINKSFSKYDFLFSGINNNKLTIDEPSKTTASVNWFSSKSDKFKLNKMGILTKIEGIDK